MDLIIAELQSLAKAGKLQRRIRHLGREPYWRPEITLNAQYVDADLFAGSLKIVGTNEVLTPVRWS